VFAFEVVASLPLLLCKEHLILTDINLVVGFNLKRISLVLALFASKLDQKRTPADGVWTKLFLSLIEASFLINAVTSASTIPDKEV
jgi:hypothetical protein